MTSRHRRRPAGLGTEQVNCLVVGDRDQPSLDIGAVGEVWIRTQRSKKGLHHAVGIGPCERTVHSQRRPTLSHDLQTVVSSSSTV